MIVVSNESYKQTLWRDLFLLTKQFYLPSAASCQRSAKQLATGAL
jgi:hypothetical protein